MRNLRRGRDVDAGKGLRVWGDPPGESSEPAPARAVPAADTRDHLLFDALLVCNRTMASAVQADAMIREICRTIVLAGGYRRAWVYWNGGSDSEDPVQVGYEMHSDDAASASSAAHCDSASFRLVYRGQTCGVLHVSASAPHDYSPAELAILNSVADSLAVAMAGLRNETRWKSQQALMRELSGQYFQLEEKERRRLAREMHDVLGQSFTMLKLLLHRAAHSPQDLLSTLKEAGAVADEMAAWCRNLMADLQMQGLQDASLVPALTAYFNRFTARTRVQVEFEHQGIAESIPPEVTLTAFRVIQEALTNVVRHAGVDRVWVVLRQERKALSVEVKDHGKGFDPGVRHGSYGLSGMKERVALLGGDFQITSRPGGGTQVVARLPLWCG